MEGFRSPYDKTAGGLHHLGRMLDKIRLRQAGRLPEDYHRKIKQKAGRQNHPACTSFDLIELSEERTPPPLK